MPVFNYKAITPTGENIHGQIEALSTDQVIQLVQDAGNIPVSASELGSEGFSLANLSLNRNRASAKDVMQFTQQVSALLGAGLALDRALHVLGELAEDGPMSTLINAVRDQVREGNPLSDALQAQHGTFSRFYVNMVRAGEAGGAMDQTLARLSDYLTRAKQLRDTIISALIYPVLLMGMAILSLVLLLVFVIPNFKPMFDDMGADLPLATQIVVAAGEALQGYWWAMVLVVIAVVSFIRGQMKNPDTRIKWDQWFLNRKLVGDLMAKAEMARLSRTLGTLLENGVPMLGALNIAQKVMSNLVMRAGLKAAAEEVKTGGGLAANMARAKCFPRLALQMISVGEETGKLDEMLMRVADSYDEEVRTAIDRLLGLLVPVLVLLMAALIGFIVISIILAMISVNDTVF